MTAYQSHFQAIFDLYKQKARVLQQAWIELNRIVAERLGRITAKWTRCQRLQCKRRYALRKGEPNWSSVWKCAYCLNRQVCCCCRELVLSTEFTLSVYPVSNCDNCTKTSAKTKLKAINLCEIDGYRKEVKREHNKSKAIPPLIMCTKHFKSHFLCEHCSICTANHQMNRTLYKSSGEKRKRCISCHPEWGNEVKRALPSSLGSSSTISAITPGHNSTAMLVKKFWIVSREFTL